MKRKFNAYNLNVGLRLFMCGLILYLGVISGYALPAMIMAAIVMRIPNIFSLSTWRRHTMLFDGVPLTEEQKKAQEELLTKIKDAQKAEIEKFKTELTQLATQAKTGMIEEKVFNQKMDEFKTKLEAFDGEKFKAYEAKMETLEKALQAQGAEMKKIQDGGAGLPVRKKSLFDELGTILKSEEWNDFVKNNGKKSVEFKLDKAVSVTSDYTGTSKVHITTRDSRVVDHPEVARLNIRDLLTVSPTDLPYLAFIEIYDWTRAARMHSENESLAASSFKVREATVSVKRLGTSLEISKRMLKSVSWIQSHIATRMPAQVRYYEDFQLLWGDNAGNNLQGLFEVIDDFADLINTPITGIAGDVASVESYDGGAKALITFTADTLINNGDNITFADADQAIYNDTFQAIVIDPKHIVITVAYAAEADVSDWTFTVASRFKNAIYAAQQIDTLKVAKTLVTRQEYRCTGIVLNPDDATMIETLKGNDEHYLDVQRLENGIMTIGGVPVVETTAMPSGKFLAGDFQLAAALLEFTNLTLEFSESTQEKLKNTVMAIIHEEVLFPIYNRYMFVGGDFSTATAAILQAS